MRLTKWVSPALAKLFLTCVIPDGRRPSRNPKEKLDSCFRRNDKSLTDFLAVISFLIILLPPFPLFACPMCSDLMNRGKDAFAAMRFGQGIAWSMILMFSVPFLLISALVFLIWRAGRRKRNQLKESLR